MNLAKRTVTLNLTNYSKSYYAKTKNVLSTHISPKVIYLKRKVDPIIYVPEE